MPTDFKKNPDQILIDLINESNGTLLFLSDIVFDLPVAIENASRNTAIRISATPSSRYTGSRDLTYDRVGVHQVTTDYDTVFELDGSTSIHALLPMLNSAYQVNFTTADVEDGPVTVEVTDDPTVLGTFTLKAKPHSLVYRGQGAVDYVSGFPPNYAAFHNFLHNTLPLDVFS